MKQQKTIRQNKAYKITLIIVFSTLVFLALFWVFVVNISGNPKTLNTIADRLQVPSSWTLKASRSEPPRFYCPGDVKCPSLQRTWKTGNLLTRDEFKAILDKSNVSFHIKGDCGLKENISGSPSVLCFAKGTIDGYSVEFDVLGTPTPDFDNSFVLRVS